MEGFIVVDDVDSVDVVGVEAVLDAFVLDTECKRMKCKSPYVAPGGLAFGCGQCLGCRINHRRIWTHRIMLEAKMHSANAFVTLTYGEMPEGGSLNARHLQSFVKLFRKNVEPLRIRFFGVGEYGGRFGRPHYHVAVFGYPGCYCFELQRPEGCALCGTVRKAWGKGHTTNQVLTEQSAAYIAAYSTKKIGQDTEQWLCGRVPPFSRMSLRPGIGASSVSVVASALRSSGLFGTDLTGALRHGSVIRPTGRYLREKLRKANGTTIEEKQKSLECHREALRGLFETAQAAAPGFRYFAFKNAIIDANAGDIARMEWLEANGRG